MFLAHYHSIDNSLLSLFVFRKYFVPCKLNIVSFVDLSLSLSVKGGTESDSRRFTNNCTPTCWLASAWATYRGQSMLCHLFCLPLYHWKVATIWEGISLRCYSKEMALKLCFLVNNTWLHLWKITQVRSVLEMLSLPGTVLLIYTHQVTSTNVTNKR